MVLPRKKLRKETTPKNESTSTQLYAPFRALGLVTNHVPFQVQVRGSKYHTKPDMSVVTCIGNQWAMWDAERLGLRFVGTQTPLPITSIVLSNSFVYASAGDFVYKFQRGKVVGKLQVESSGIGIATLCTFGSTLIGLSEDGQNMTVWNLETDEVIDTIDFPQGFTATHIIHPSTYLNKVVIGSKEGAIAIWNVQNSALIHTFTSYEIRSSSKSPSPISAITQSPAVDVLAIGFRDGYTSIFDIRMGEQLLNVSMTTTSHDQDDVAITAIAFRDDNIAQTLVTASHAGHLAVWSLDESARLIQLLRNAHDQPITSLTFLPRQPVVMSSSGDNSVKQWLFETPTSPARLLKHRSGHQTPPSKIMFYGDDGKAILSAGSGSEKAAFRYTSVVRDARSYELSQGSHVKRKLPQVVAMDFSTSRSKDWDDLLTVHNNEVVARTWSVPGKRKGKYTFGDVQGKNGLAQAVCVTSCGNFGLVGFSKSGKVHMWNMQSGQMRKVFKVPSLSQNEQQSSSSLNITGIATDSLNQMVIAASASGHLHFFDFHTTKLIGTLELTSPVASLILQRDSGLMAVSCEDMIVRIIDIETRRVVRELKGVNSRLLGMTFSPDSRWLVTTSLDSIIRTFDLPTGRIISAFKPHSLATSVSFSPTGDFLASCHVDSVGVYLWVNRAQFIDIPLQDFESSAPVSLELPQLKGDNEDEEENNDDEIQELTDADLQNKSGGIHSGLPKDNVEQLSDDLMTLSLMPRAKWQALLNLETIKERNKPIQPEKPPEQVPFFIPTLPGVDVRFDVSKKVNGDSKQQNGEEAKSRRLDLGSMDVDSDFVARLRKEDANGDYSKFFEYACDLAPSALDIEIRSLNLRQLNLLLHSLLQRMKSQKDFDVVQAILAVVVKTQGEALMNASQQNDDDDGIVKLNELVQQVQKESSRLNQLVGYCLGALQHIRGLPVT